MNFLSLLNMLITRYFLCKHKSVGIVKYKTCRSGQELRLRPRHQFYICNDCGRDLGRLEYLHIQPRIN